MNYIYVPNSILNTFDYLDDLDLKENPLQQEYYT